MAEAGAHLLVSGLVQGVGFRYFALKKATLYGIRGFAKNLMDGRVELLAEGEKGMVEDFIKDLRSGPISAHVADIRIEWLAPTYNYKGFQIL